jgi:hypothetical protein
MRRGIILFFLIWAIIGAFKEGEVLGENIRNVILISWDGTQRNHLKELLDKGKLPHLAELISEGTFTEIEIPPFIRDKDEKVTAITNPLQMKLEDEIYYEQAVTDAGHARMLTGKWNVLTDVFESIPHEWIDYLCGNNLKIVKDGLTIMEIIKERRPDIYTGVLAARHADLRNYTDNYDKLLAVFRGWGDEEIYTVKLEGIGAIGSHGFYSTTFKNAEDDLDLFFDSEKIPPILRRFYKNNCYAHLYDASTNKLLALIELKDDFVAKKAVNFIKRIAPQNQFFLFIHFCEPDCFGHFYGENSDEYSKAIISNDEALGIIVKGLKEVDAFNSDLKSLYEETLIIITTDHGANEDASPANIVEKLGKKWLIKLGPLHGNMDSDNHLIWMVNNKDKSLPYRILQTEITPIILDVFGI